MASRVSKTWTKKNIEVNLKEKVSSANMPDYLLAMQEKDITFDFLMSLFGTFEGKNIANPYDLLVVPANTFKYEDNDNNVKYNKSEFTTTIGLYIFNLLLSGNGMTKVTGYVNENLNSKKYKKIERGMVYALIENRITVDQFKNWQMTLQWLMPLQDIISTNHTEKLLLVSKAIAKEKAKLIKDNQEAINSGDPKVIEDSEKQLIEKAKEYLGDDPGTDSIMSGAGASFNNQFKNMYLIKGAISDPDPNAKQKYNIVTSSYIEGINQTEYSLLAQSGANGSYSRGKKTSTGGYWEKLFINSLQHIHLDPVGSDCGTKRYIEVLLTEDNLNDYIYSYIVKNDDTLELLDSKSCKKYFGKKIKLRYSSLCESRTGICNKCAGDLLYITASRNVGAVTGQIPDRLKNICMKAFHDSTVTNYVIKDLDAIFYPDK